jgi:hypothetical protein
MEIDSLVGNLSSLLRCKHLDLSGNCAYCANMNLCGRTVKAMQVAKRRMIRMRVDSHR